MIKSKSIDYNQIPEHIAIVMDGNGRWAQSRGLPRLAGHNAGMKSLKKIVEASSEMGLKYLTVYAFSTENWKRPADEVSGIFKILVFYIEKELKELHANNVKVNIIGDFKKLPKEAVDQLARSLETTRENTGMVFNIALNYGSRDEIMSAVRALAQKSKEGTIDPETLSEIDFENYMYTKDIPDPDLIIRTSGEMRLSNFLLWQSAYSELYFTDILWPDFKKSDLEKAIIEYQNRKRRYGGV
ncbi:MAG: isoprenyl transferase [Eubacteriales bacterium]